MRAVVLASLAIAGCYHDTSIACGDLVCPPTTVCVQAAHLCATPAQLAACDGLGDGIRCSYPGNPDGVCRSSACVPVGCGNGVLDPGEICDDGNTTYGDGCRGDCQGRFDKQQTPTGLALNAVFAISATDVYAVGDGGAVIHWDGTAWSNVTLGIGVDGSIRRAVWGSGPHDVYIGGDDGLFHFNGSTWAVVGGIANVTTLYGTAADDVWVGTADVVPLSHFDGATWTAIDLSVCTIFAGGAQSVWASGRANVFVTFGLQMCHYDGSTWTHVPPTNAYDKGKIAGASATEVYYVDAKYGVLGTWNGATFVMEQAPGLVGSLAITRPGQFLAVGPGGLILQHDETGWLHLVSPTEADLHDITASGPDDVFVVGTPGIVLH